MLVSYFGGEGGAAAHQLQQVSLFACAGSGAAACNAQAVVSIDCSSLLQLGQKTAAKESKLSRWVLPLNPLLSALDRVFSAGAESALHRQICDTPAQGQSEK